MCLVSTKTMDLPYTLIQKLKAVIQRQRIYCNRLNLKELSTADYEHYNQVRSQCVEYIKVPHIYFGGQADTFATAVAILDVFLWKVKVTEKHINIVAVACFYIASKMLESEETSPTSRDLASLHCWTSKDLCRMEMHVLKKLDWHIGLVTYLDLLPHLADVYGLDRNIVTSPDVLRLAQRFLARHSTIMATPAVLALAIIQYILGETKNCPTELQVRVHCNIDDHQLNGCVKTLTSLAATEITPPPSPPRITPKFPMKIFDRPSMQGVTPLYTIAEETPMIQV